jgi:hypothetical protein
MTSGKVPLDEQHFTAYMADRFRQAVPDCPVTVEGPLKITIQTTRDPLNCMLDRAFDYCQSHPSEGAGWLEGYVEKIRTYIAGMNAPIDRTMLRVVVRDKDYIENARQGAAAKGSEMAIEPLTEDLSAACYIDMPTALRSAATPDFKALGLSPAEALALAKANQAADQDDFQAKLKDLGDGVAIIQGDVYHSSWFALHEAWADLADRYEEGLLVAVPAMDTLLYARESEDSIIAMHEAAEDVADQSERPISKSVYRWETDGWTRLNGPIRIGGKNVYLRPKP